MYNSEVAHEVQMLVRAELGSVKNCVINKVYTWHYTLQLLNRRDTTLQITHYHFFVHGMCAGGHEVHGPGLGPHHQRTVHAGCLLTAKHSLHTYKPQGAISGYLRAEVRGLPFQLQLPMLYVDTTQTATTLPL